MWPGSQSLLLHRFIRTLVPGKERIRMNTIIRKFARRCAIAGSVLLFSLAAPVQANEVILCASINGLDSCLEYLQFSNPDKDKAALKVKLVEASDKIYEGKNCDAVQKLNNFRDKLYRLTGGGKPKVSESFPGTLLCLEEGSLALIAELELDTESDCVDDTGPKGRGPKNR